MLYVSAGLNGRQVFRSTADVPHNPLQCRLEHLYRSNYNPTTKIWTLFVGELPPHTVSPHPSL